MGYLTKNSQNLIVSKLTDVGRRKISQGKFNIAYFQIGDSEINYDLFDVSTYAQSSTMILEPSFNSHNNSGIPESTKNGIKYPYYLEGTSGVTYGIPFQASSIDNIYNNGPSLGFFNNSTLKPISTGVCYNSQYTILTNAMNGVNSFALSSLGSCPNDQNTLQISAKTYVTIFITNESFANICNNAPLSSYPILTYKVKSVNTNIITFDRALPDYDTPYNNLVTKVNRTFFYYSGMSGYDFKNPLGYYPNDIINYESVCLPETGTTNIWNMNIPWSENPAGQNSLNFNYYDFPSSFYLGAKEYYGYTSNDGQIDTSGTSYYNSHNEKIILDSVDQKAVAIVHYTNNCIIDFFGEKIATLSTSAAGTPGLASNFMVHLPWLMWHRKTSLVACGQGVKFYIDPPGFSTLELLQPFYLKSTKNATMNEPGIRYYHLYDTIANSSDGGRPNRVGKVFPDDKIIIFDDEEIVAAMSYASNRNFTLPAPKIKLVDCVSDSGLLSSEEETLWVTYLLNNTFWSFMHCNYYSKITGPLTSCTVSQQDVLVSFGGNFNCMSQPTTQFGQGFTAQEFYILAQKVKNGERPSSNKWKIINFTDEVTLNAQDFINPNSLINSFIITKNKYDNANTYDINNYLVLPKTNSVTNYEQIQFGEEFYFYGNVSADTESTIYESRFLINLPNGQFVKSSNPTWNANRATYMTEIGLFDEDKNLLVYSKFTNPNARQGIQQAVVKLEI